MKEREHNVSTDIALKKCVASAKKCNVASIPEESRAQ